MRILPLALVALLLSASPLRARDVFEEKIHAILKAKCLGCHDESKRTSGFSVEDIESVISGGAKHGIAVKPGNPDGSPLVKMLRGEIKPQMPFGGELQKTDISIVEDWIKNLSPEVLEAAKQEGRYWAFEKSVPRDPPAVENEQRVRNEIDNFIFAKLEGKGLAPAREAEPGALVRRLYFDLIGLPPPPEEVEAFVADSSSSNYQALVDRLLDDSRYGERWGRHWLDLARYADTNGFEGDPEYPHAWRYRDYVIDAFNNDKPYDEFVKEQIAGDEFELEVFPFKAIPTPDPEKSVALTFLRLAPFTEPRGEEDRDVILSEMTSTVGSVFLGMTVGCAKCHDHKYDSIPTKDFYRMKAFFSTVQIARPYADDIQQLGGPQPAEFYKPGEKEWAGRERAKFTKDLEETEANFKGFYEPLLVRLKKQRESENEKAPKEEGEEEKEKELALADLRKAIDSESDNTSSDFGKKKTIFSDAEIQEFARYNERVGRLKKAILRVAPLAMSLTHALGPPYGPNVPTTYVLQRGEWNRPGEPVKPGFLSAIEGHSNPAVLIQDRFKSIPTRFRRLVLANWIASPDNPLTARVMVNRMWQHHFGRGIVATPSDFGKNGAPPSHPELLDWLSTRFVKAKWSVKAMHRLILNSATYRQASIRQDSQAEKIDRDNRLLWRFNRRRLDGEVIRDSILAVSGRLNSARGGPAVFPPLPKGLDEAQKVQTVNIWETTHGPEGRKRSIYTYQRRSLSLPLLELFDAPVCNDSRDHRRNSVTALQALTMYDGEFVNEEVRHFANRVLKETNSDVDKGYLRAFQLSLGRKPRDWELEQVKESLGSVGSLEDTLLALCRVLLNSNEFIYVD